MTDKEKLQKLFDAALKEPLPATGGSPKRAFPETSTAQAFVPAPPVRNAPAVSFEASLPDPDLADRIQEPRAPQALAGAAPNSAVLDDAASTELGALLDEQIKRQSRKRRRESLIAALVLFGLFGGGFGWFVQSPDRIEAFRSALREIRSVGDVKAIVAKYQAALDKISARSQQIDQATAAMGVKAGPEDDKDPNFDAEMKEMMGGKGKTVGERNKGLQKAFGDRAKANGGEPKAIAAVKKDDSFQWNQ